MYGPSQLDSYKLGEKGVYFILSTLERKYLNGFKD